MSREGGEVLSRRQALMVVTDREARSKRARQGRDACGGPSCT
jgi:hypothetical protein